MKKKLAVDLMLDSGAFSAWNRGTTIDLKKYAAYIKRLEKYLFSYVTLDVLPEGQESKRTTESIEAGAKKSHINHKKLKDAGLSPIPVFHQGESFHWLEQMLKDGEKYIGVSARKDLRTKDHVKWLDQVYRMLTDKKGKSIVKTHGFGITNPKLLLRYPFYTVDSTTWSMTPGYGQIIVPVLVDGKFDYSRVPSRIIVSGIQQKSSQQQFEGMGPMGQAAITKYLDEIGTNITQVRYGTDERRRCVLHYYLKLAEYLRKHESTSQFQLRDDLLIMFATALKNKEWSALMCDMSARTRLLSFFETQDADDEALIEYVETGKFGDKIKRAPKARFDNEGYRNFRRLKLAERGRQYAEDGTTEQANDR